MSENAMKVFSTFRAVENPTLRQAQGRLSRKTSGKWGTPPSFCFSRRKTYGSSGSGARFAAVVLACWLAACLVYAQSTAKPSPALPQAVPAAQSAGGYRIAGIIVSKIDGHPLSRARVMVSEVNDDQKSESVITGDDGRFEFRGVPPGQYSLHGDKRGFISSAYDQHENYWSAIVTGAGVDTENLVLKLEPAAAIAGQVLDESGDPIRRATVTLYRVDHSEGVEQIRPMNSRQTDDLGSYEFSLLNAGTYFIAAKAQPWYAVHPQTKASDTASNFDHTLDVTYALTYYSDTTESDSATPIPVRGGERLQVDFHLNPVPGLRLIFHVAGNERIGFNFPVLEQPSFDGSTNVETGGVRMISPGVVEISGVPAGRYDIRLPGAGGATQMSGVDLTEDGEEINTSAAAGLGEVKITAKMSNGSPLPKHLSVGFNAKWRLLPGPPELDDRGQAELSQISPGRYEVMAWSSGDKQFFVSQISADGAEVTGHTVTITAGASVSLAVILCSGSAEVEGTVKQQGKPFSGAMVVLVPRNPEGNGDLFRRDQSNLDGTFALHSVIPGSYTLIAIEDGWDLDWSQPQVIGAYAKHGRSIQIRNGSSGTLRISPAIDVQPK